MRHALVVVACLFCLLAGPALGAEAKPDAAALAEKPLTVALGKDLLTGARGAARLGIRWLKAKCEKDEQGIWFPPVPQVTQIQTGWKTVSVTRPVYKTVIMDVPIRKIVGYEWVWVTEKDPKDPYAPVGRKRIQEPIWKVVGTRKEERSVPDGDKTQVVQEKHPVYQRSDEVMIFTRWTEGINALALYTLLEGGEPADSPTVKRAAQWLQDCTLESHSIPDTTCEISLFIMAFCRLDKEKYGAFTNAMLEKLVRGQIEDGESRGLWGMYSVDIESLKANQVKEMKGVMLREKFDAELAEAKRELAATAAKREQARLNARIKETQQAIDRINDELKKVREKMTALSRDFTRGEDWAKARRSERLGGDIRYYPGALYDARFSSRADLSNTHLALAALCEARRRGRLTDDSALGKEAFAAIARTAHALVKLQERDGSWGYCMHEQHTRKPPDDPNAGKPQENPNQPSMEMTAAGLACLDSIVELAGRDKARLVIGEAIDKTRAAALSQLDCYSKPGVKPPIPVSVQFSSLYYCFALATALDDPGLARTRLGAIPEGLVCRLLFSQENDGAWPLLPAYSLGSSVYTHSRLHKLWTQSIYESRFDHQLVNTCFAILTLCEFGRPTIGGQWHLAGKPDLALDAELEAICLSLASEAKVRPRWRSLPAELPAGLAAFCPALVLTATPGVKDKLAAAQEQLGTYLKDGGLLVVQVFTRGDAAVADAVKGQLGRLFKDVAFRPLPDEHPAFSYARKLRKPAAVEAAWDGDRLLAVFLIEQGGGLARGDVYDVTRNLLAERVRLNDLEPGSVVGPKEWDTVEQDIEAAIARIKEQRIVAPEVPPEQPAPKAEPEKKPEPGKVPEKKPEPDKKIEPEKKLEPEKAKPPEKTVDELIKEINEEPKPKPKPDGEKPKEDEKF